MTVFYFEHGMATIYSFTADPEVIELYGYTKKREQQ